MVSTPSYSGPIVNCIGTNLQTLVDYEKKRYSHLHLRDVPLIVQKSLKFMRTYGGLGTEGLFRVPGNETIVSKLINDFDEGRGEKLNFFKAGFAVEDIASLMKKFFRELPEGLLTNPLEKEFLDVMKSTSAVAMLYDDYISFSSHISYSHCNLPFFLQHTHVQPRISYNAPNKFVPSLRNCPRPTRQLVRSCSSSSFRSPTTRTVTRSVK